MPSCLDPLQRAARAQWGYQGYVTSDSDSIADAYQKHHYVATGADATCLALSRGGCDIDSGMHRTHTTHHTPHTTHHTPHTTHTLACSGNTYYDNIALGLNQSKCSMQDVDRALFNSIRVRFELGLFDPTGDQPYWRYGAGDIGTAKARALNQRAAESSLVLLHNGGAGAGRTNRQEGRVLPLRAGARIAVLGPHGNASRALIQVDTGYICPSLDFSCVETPFQAIQALNEGGATFYEQGCDVIGNSTEGFAAALAQVSRMAVLPTVCRGDCAMYFSRICVCRRRPGRPMQWF